MTPQVFNGRELTAVDPAAVAGKPVPPVERGNDQIFISVPTYRDGERCGETLKSIFENAKDPKRVFVGVVEQNAPEDQFCVEQYCKSFGMKTIDRKIVREGVTKIMTADDARKDCPYHDQIKVVAFHNINAKGPIYARALGRKILGNEEYCMQIDAHSELVKDWDEKVIGEWRAAGNEFGVISAVPPTKTEKDAYSSGGADSAKVPRQCSIAFRENGFPDYMSPADGYALDLDRPLLSHGWSAAFSFAKCHLEESAPYDPFLYYSMPIEQFSRYARFWTRGYDTYTPTQNIVFHEYEPQTNGHGNLEWFKRQKDRFRKEAIARVKTALQIPGGNPGEKEQANLGIYGLGKRRSLKQFEEFVNMDLKKGTGNVGVNLRCSGASWVPYDASISPIENLFDNADNLDPQPEYPLRTALTYYEQVLAAPPALDLELGEQHPDTFRELHDATGVQGKLMSMPPLPVLFLFWVFGLMVWYALFFGSSGSNGGSNGRPRNKSHAKDV